MDSVRVWLFMADMRGNVTPGTTPGIIPDPKLFVFPLVTTPRNTIGLYAVGTVLVAGVEDFLFRSDPGSYAGSQHLHDWLHGDPGRTDRV